MIIFAVFPSKMRLYVRGLAAATVAAACGLGVLSGSAEATTYTFETLNNAADPTFNQLLGINSGGLISGYLGSGAVGHPNKGYLLAPPLWTGGLQKRELPRFGSDPGHRFERQWDHRWVLFRHEHWPAE